MRVKFLRVSLIVIGLTAFVVWFAGLGMHHTFLRIQFYH